MNSSWWTRRVFNNPARPPRPYVVINQWDFVKVANGLGLPFAQAVNTAAAFDTAFSGAKAVNGPALIVAQVNPHDLPAELP
jgi:indolepyruvate decarboxylase